ncbi:FG-GAP repeat domain-containing protein [Psychromonas sp. KJ10-10]|uniref:FG-GAP repeat domain-containing protein n=1 Tax=Psychromonas sp. KJ10-10 TaxID=3391823 RepID=UPI0039B3765E
MRTTIALLLLILWLSSNIRPTSANELSIYPSESPLPVNINKTQAGQLPLSRVAYGTKNIAKAWFAGATDRYQHNVLGDALEASLLVVEMADGKRLKIELPSNRVFEDLEPRLVDINNDGSEDIIVIESDTRSGASLAVYSIIDFQLVKIASSPFIGTPYRWLNPVGAGDFDGDGEVDIVAIITPHIGGFLRLYHLTGDKLIEFAEYSGASTHSIGSTELGLGQVIASITARSIARA